MRVSADCSASVLPLAKHSAQHHLERGAARKEYNCDAQSTRGLPRMYLQTSRLQYNLQKVGIFQKAHSDKNIQAEACKDIIS